MMEYGKKRVFIITNILGEIILARMVDELIGYGGVIEIKDVNNTSYAILMELDEQRFEHKKIKQ